MCHAKAGPRTTQCGERPTCLEQRFPIFCGSTMPGADQPDRVATGTKSQLSTRAVLAELPEQRVRTTVTASQSQFEIVASCIAGSAAPTTTAALGTPSGL